MAVVRFVAALVLAQILALAIITSCETETKHRQLGKSQSLTDEEIVQILRGYPEESIAEFLSFKDKYEKVYATKQEVLKRYAIFTANVKYINEQNAKHLSYKLGINQWADLTAEEFAAAHGMNSTIPGQGGSP